MRSMISKSFVKRALCSLLISSVFLGLLSFAPVSMAALINPGDNPASIAAQTGGESDLKSFVLTIVNFILLFLGFVCVIFIIYAGFLYITSGTSEDGPDNAKKIIKNSIIGIVIILASFAIVNTVLQATTSTVGSGVVTQ